MLAGLAVCLVALAVRLFEVRDVPRLTDETDEVMLGLAIARGEALPLTNVDAYIGPLWNYLLAVGFLILGPTAAWPRALTVTVGMLTVAATGWLGYEVARRLELHRLAVLVGQASALLLATSSFHTAVSSRIGWSHSLTPLAMTLALACLLRWERTRNARLLAGLGIAYGITVHTHPTAIAFGPGLLLWALFSWRDVVLHRAGWVAAALFVLANAPMLVFNIATGFRSLQAAAQVQSAYADRAATGFSSYPTNLDTLIWTLPLLLSGDIGEQRGAMLVVDDPMHVLYAALACLGLVAVTRVRCWGPLLAIVSGVLVLPAVNGKYEPLFNGRYIGPLLPLGLTLVVVGVVVIIVRVAWMQRRALPVVAGIVVGLCVFPLLALHGYVTSASRHGPNNREFFRAVEISAAASGGAPVLIDASLSGTRLSTGREGTGVLDYLVQLHGGVETRRYDQDDLIRAARRGEGPIVVASPRLIARLGKDFLLDMPPGEGEARARRRSAFEVVRIVRPVNGAS